MKTITGLLLTIVVSFMSATAQSALINYKGGQFDTDAAANSAVNIANQSQGRSLMETFTMGFTASGPMVHR